MSVQNGVVQYNNSAGVLSFKNSADTKTNVSCFQRLPDQIKERNEKLKDEMFGKSF